jgi:hypothetical protein
MPSIGFVFHRMNFQPPVFVIGSPRSGTSLLRLILTTHSKIVIPPECGFIVWLHGKFGSWSSSEATDAKWKLQFLDELFACKKFDTWGLERNALDTILTERQPDDYASLCATVYMAFALKQEKKPLVWGDKNNFHTSCLPVLSTIFPEARFLHIVRDGRDVACSYREVMQHSSLSPYSPHLATEIDEIANEWSTNVLRVDNYLAGIEAARRRLIRYEDMVHDTAASIADICQWLGLTFEDEMLAVHEANRRMKLEPALTLDWKRRTLEPVSAKTVGRYQNVLSASEKIRFTKLAGDTLAKFGYVSGDALEKGRP